MADWGRGGPVAWRRVALMVVALGVSIWLGANVLATGMAGFHEERDAGAQAAVWRPGSPAALSLSAEAAVAAADYRRADDLALRSLERSPLNADALRALGLSAAAQGQDDRSQLLIARAARLNARDSDSQEWLMERAIQSRRFADALVHADAMMRRSPAARRALTWRIVSILGEPAGRAAVAARLARMPPWRQEFLISAVQNGVVGDVSALLEALSRTSRPPSDDELSPFFNRLVGLGRFADIHRYWLTLARRSSGDGQPYVFDGGFENLGGPTPVSWQPLGVLGGQAVWRDSSDRPLGQLRLVHDGFSSSSRMVQQLIFLPPGSYVVRASASVDEPVADGRFKLEISCVEGAPLAVLPLPAKPAQWRRAEVGFEAPAEGCQAQWLAFKPVVGERREALEMKVDDVEITRRASGSALPSRPAP